ncbi:outer membrane lipoprotein LolB [Methylomarinovum tepidoasis]|uniref:Outer-membrane lipoprotein LolB n=1 Tax=Methylomarinovum tepidoasis TaxID=2840183 RepID=A0AAU9CA35_9GAMM|nr:lipoprotein insertase outer membrane protein LolB [Methylomarinovum sp. IN45]BCX88787.1 outer membrane lipoprotein LolB [Methylomarinovum sp. IN45]
MSRIPLLLLLLALAGCAAWRKPPLPAAGEAERRWRSGLIERPWQLQGRIGVSGGRDSWHGHLRWEHGQGLDRLVLSGPFGQGGVVVEVGSGWIRLRYPDGRILESAEPDRLLRQVLGVVVPLAALRYWVLGLTAPGPAAVEHDLAGRLQRLRQQGWEVGYLAYGAVAAGALPTKLQLLGPDGVRVKLLIDRWEIDRDRT